MEENELRENLFSAAYLYAIKTNPSLKIERRDFIVSNPDGTYEWNVPGVPRPTRSELKNFTKRQCELVTQALQASRDILNGKYVKVNADVRQLLRVDEGSICYNTTIHKIEIFEGGEWRPFT